MKRLRYLVALLPLALLIVAALLPGLAQAANDTAEGALLLSAGTPSYTDQLVGSTGGAARYYRIEYAGNGQPVPIFVNASPNKGTTGEGFGFNVYGPNGLLGRAVIENSGDTWTSYALTLASATPGRYVVQVYNYTNGVAVNYTLTANGLAGADVSTGAAPTAVANTSPGAAVSLPGSTNVTGGSLSGQKDGSFQYFNLTYPGGNEELKVEMVYRPRTPFSNNAVGFNLWAGRDEKPLARSQETKRDADSATTVATYRGEAGRVVQVQVFNYEPGLTISYTLLVSGTSGFITNISDNVSGDRAYLLTAQTGSASATLPASAEASFNYYLINYPGGGRDVTISISTLATSTLSDTNFGFNIYEGAKLKKSMGSHLDDLGENRVATYTIDQSEAATLGIQVFRWAPGDPLNYFIFVSGLD